MTHCCTVAYKFQGMTSIVREPVDARWVAQSASPSPLGNWPTATVRPLLSNCQHSGLLG